MSRGLQSVFFATAFVILLLACPCVQGQGAKRLILQDGSYQLASRWEVKGERVRYFSTERSEWEEIPNSLVDWKATEEYGKQVEAERALELRHAQEEDAAEEKSDISATPAVAPGLRLPNSGGAFLLDAYNQRPQLAELAQNAGEWKRQTGSNILHGVVNPVATSKKSIEIKGEHARVQSHALQPAFFFDLDQDPKSPPLPPAERFRIVSLAQKKDARVIANVRIGVTGKVDQQESFIAARAEKLADNWIKLVPAQPLPPGEYAVVEMLNSQDMNLYVWDFGVDPSAPENAGALKPAEEPQPAATAPTLENRFR